MEWHNANRERPWEKRPTKRDTTQRKATRLKPLSIRAAVNFRVGIPANVTHKFP